MLQTTAYIARNSRAVHNGLLGVEVDGGGWGGGGVLY